MIEIFILSFLIALTGALVPGPVLTFTIYKSLKGKKGYLAGFLIILGHALLEFSLILLLLLGASLFFRSILILTIIAIVGGVFLALFGLIVIKDAVKKKVQLNFTIADEEIKGFHGNSFLGGIILSLSNPYWSFWWAVIGLSLMINLNISFENPMGLMLFFLGHELGDFSLYVPISIFTYFGGQSLNQKIYKWILIACGVFMIGFGIYLAFNIILFPPQI